MSGRGIKAFLVTEVGSTDDRRVVAANDYYAVAEVAGCAVNDVPIAIWRSGQLWRGSQEYALRCYMPCDDSGRQWLVRDAGGVA